MSVEGCKNNDPPLENKYESLDISFACPNSLNESLKLFKFRPEKNTAFQKFINRYKQGAMITSLQNLDKVILHATTLNIMKNSEKTTKCFFNTNAISSNLSSSICQFGSRYRSDPSSHPNKQSFLSLLPLKYSDEALKYNTCILRYKNLNRLDFYIKPFSGKFKFSEDHHSLALSKLPVSSLCPIGICIDSEYKDLTKSSVSPFYNKRDVYPISLSASIFGFTDHSESIYFNYIMDTNNYNYLKDHNHISQDLKQSLRLCPYNTYTNQNNMCSTGYNLTCENEQFTLKHNQINEYNHHQPFTEDDTIPEPICISEKTVFKSVLDELDSLAYNKSQFYTNIQDKSNSDKSLLYYIPPEVVPKLSKSHDFTIIPIFNFFSFKDYKYFFGETVYHIIEKYILIRRCINFSTQSNKDKRLNISPISNFGFIYKIGNHVHYIKIKICDFAGLTGSGLKDLAATTGVKLSLKDDLNKEDMEYSLLNEPQKYLQYCVEDTIHLFQMGIKFSILNMHTYEKFGINKFPPLLTYSKDSLKLTNGSNIAKLLQSYIKGLHPNMEKVLNRISIKKQMAPNKLPQTIIEGIEMGSAKYLRHLGDSSLEGCFISGGRCCSERPQEINFSYGADIDLVSCYGTSIKELFYPIGVPLVLRFSTENDKITLRNFLKKRQADLYPGCWYAVVSTKKGKPLKYLYDLFVSKILSENSYENNMEDDETSSSHVKGEQLVLCQEVQNAVIVQEHLDIIQKMACNDEKADLYDNLYIQMAVYYPRQLMCENIDVFVEKITRYNHGSESSTFKEYDTRKDDRPFYWYPAPMNKFVGPLIEERVINQRKYREGGGEEYNSIQLYLKKSINMVYGSSASEYFPINNLCFANNVTGRAKACVWLLSKALNTCMSVTDGGIYELFKVNYFWHPDNKQGLKHKKPGLSSLFNLSVYQTGFFKPLGSIRGGRVKKIPDFPRLLDHINQKKRYYLAKMLTNALDKIALEHINEFCKLYGLQNSFIYKVEHKSQNMFIKAATLNRGHYALYSVFDQTSCKARGFQQKEGMDHIKSFIFPILIDKALSKNSVLDKLATTHTSLLSPIEIKRLRDKQLIDYKTGIHDTYVYTKQLSFKIDCGKFKSYNNFKCLQSKYYQIDRFSYLNYVYLENGQYIFNGIEYWKYYHRKIGQFCFGEPECKRTSKNTNEICSKILEIGSSIDNFFKPDILNYKDDFDLL